MGCMANLIHGLADSMGLPRELFMMRLEMELRNRTFEEK